jgi:hypothetical protein
MQTLTRDEYLRLTGISSATLDNRTRWGQMVFAFGEVPAGHGLYTPLDVLLARTLDVLAPQLGGRRSAADILRIQSVWWLEAVERAEWSRPRIECYFAIVIRRPHWPWQNHPDDFFHESRAGTLIEIGAALGGQPPAQRFTLPLVNLSDLIAEVRETGRRLRIDLSAPFTLPTDHPNYDARQKEIAAYRRGAKERLRAKGRKPSRPAAHKRVKADA